MKFEGFTSQIIKFISKGYKWKTLRKLEKIPKHLNTRIKLKWTYMQRTFKLIFIRLYNTDLRYLMWKPSKELKKCNKQNRS